MSFHPLSFSFLFYSNKRPFHPFPISISRFYRSKRSCKISQFHSSLTCRPLGFPRYSRAEGQRSLRNSWLPIRFLWPSQETCITYYSGLSTLITGIEHFISEQAKKKKKKHQNSTIILGQVVRLKKRSVGYR